MCIRMTFKQEIQKKMISKLPDGLFTVYKVVDKHKGSYHPLYYGGRYSVGLNTARNGESYDDQCLWGFHSFKTEAAAKELFKQGWNTYNWRVVKFRIRKSWIKAIGRECNNCICYVTDRIMSPSLRNKDAVVS